MRYVPNLRWGVGVLAVSGLMLCAPGAHAGLGSSLKKATGKAKEKLAQGQAAVDKVDQAGNKADRAGEKLKALSSTASAESLLSSELGLDDNTSSAVPSAPSGSTPPPSGGRAVRGTKSGGGGGAAGKGAASGGVVAGGAGGATTPAVTPPAATTPGTSRKAQILRVVLLDPVADGAPAGTDVEWNLGITMWDNATHKWVAPPASPDLHGKAVVSYGIKANGDMKLETQELSDVKFSGGHKPFNDRGLTGECIPGGKVTFSLPTCAVAGVKLELKSEQRVGQGGLGFVYSSRIANSDACTE